MTAYIEVAASWLFKNQKGRDGKLVPTLPAFALHPNPTIPVTSPDCGPDGSTLGKEYMHGGKGLLPELKWETVEGVKEWVMFSEDPDAPLPTPICHGIYLGISKDKTSVTNEDFKSEDASTTRLKGGFFYGQSRNGSIYIAPRPLINHGIHRYFFEVVALNEPLDPTFVASKPARDAVAKAIEGKVLAWGRWVGECERKWE
ncbi:Fc.00g076710.m01.CDS01 [Cosmosporella sp. VM-42]